MAGERGISAEVVNRILFGDGEAQRFTQDTPILPEVWQLYAAEPRKLRELLITPRQDVSAVRLLRTLRERLERSGSNLRNAKPAPLQSFVAVDLRFDELIRVVLPLTEWAQKAVKQYSRWLEQPNRRPLTGREVFRIVYRHAAGRLPAGAEPAEDMEPLVVRGGLFETLRILTLVAAIYAVAEGRRGIAKLSDLSGYEEAIARIIELLADTFLQGETLAAEVWRVAANRQIRKADEYARSTVKADAAFRVFDVRCEKITWAVVDSGIHGNHPAFTYPCPETGRLVSRVTQTYNLGLLRSLLNAAYAGRPARNPALQLCIQGSGLDPETALRHLKNAYQSYETEMLDWSSIEPLLRMTDPSPPADGHGTHVAGIIGAEWRQNDPPIVGMCPDIRLMDFRILGQNLDETEFAVIGALQLVRYLNSHNQYIVVHGVNLSLQIPHMVENYACGRTPVCDECERLVGAGVTVVAAAGNHGYQRFKTDKGEFANYASFSITDPGNADSVITVGSTHRREPHTYGISYFSSRGPTGDGRMKPDLVAPGERILSTLPEDESGYLDGTSQAAPHVSAAAAMLMARYPELNKQPRRIKRILCESATDLGRERFFQGHGLLDVLRALQSF